jgi:choline-glycine betaine transporter
MSSPAGTGLTCHTRLVTEDSPPAERLDRKVFSIAIAVLAAFSLAMVLSPDGSRMTANAALAWLTDRLGWFYLLAGMAPLAMASWLAFGRYGDVLLGPEGEPPIPVRPSPVPTLSRWTC